jgi:PAS domain S-box-containing protein
MLGVAGASLVGALLLGAAVSAGLSAYVWRHADTPARLPFVGMTATDALWVGLYAVGLTVSVPELRLLFEGLYLAGALFVGAWWVLFGLAYTGRTDLVTPTVGVALAVPGLLVVVAVVTDPASVVGAATTAQVSTVGGLRTVAGAGRGVATPAYAALMLYLFATVVVGFALVLRTVIEERSLYAAQTGWIVASSVPASVAGVADAVQVGPVPGLHLVPFTVPVVMAGFAVATFRHDMRDLTPATGRVGREAALRDLADPVVVTDGDGRVADLNPAAEETFGVAREDALGCALAATAGAAPDTAFLDGATLTLHTADGRRRFEVSASAVVPEGDRSVGRALVFRDVTRRQFREQRLAVFNRVVRHNLRNDMNVVAGHADLLAARIEAADAGGHDHAETIGEIATELVDLGQKAHDFEEAVSGSEGAHPVAVPEVLAHVCRGLEDGRAAVNVDAADVTVVTDGSVLELVVENVVENALEHAGSDPTVTVEAHAHGDGVRIAVSDDGPGIPAEERSVFESGGESPLEHGSGLGLWIVAWGTQWLGGTVALDCEDGTRVTVDVPSREVGTQPAPTVDALSVDDTPRRTRPDTAAPADADPATDDAGERRDSTASSGGP